MMMKMR